MSKIRTIPFPLLSVLLLAACDSSRLTDGAPLSGEQPDEGGQSPDTAEMNRALITAAANGDVAATRRLLVDGADDQTTGARGTTLLIAVAYPNHVEIARLLIVAGADVNVQDETQQSAHLINTSEGHLEIFQLTLAAGADVHSRDRFNWIRLIRPADRGHAEIITGGHRSAGSNSHRYGRWAGSGRNANRLVSKTGRRSESIRPGCLPPSPMMVRGIHP